MHKSFGDQKVLQGIDLEVNVGEITVIIGASLVPGLPNMYSTPSDSNIFKRACLPAMRVNYWVLLCAYC